MKETEKNELRDKGSVWTDWTKENNGGETMNGAKAICPQCGGPLVKVTQESGSMFNEFQWRSMIAGDYCCETCPDNGRAKNKKAYFWEKEIPSLAPPAEPDTGVQRDGTELLAQIRQGAECGRGRCLDCDTIAKLIDSFISGKPDAPRR